MLTASLDRQVVLERYGKDAPRVLALHGWGRGRQDWAAVLKGLDAYAPDLPGFGLSPAPPQDWGARDYATFLQPLLAEMDRPILIGHSFGGRIAVHLAVLSPDAISGVVLTGTPLVRVGPRKKPKPGYRVARRLHKMGIVSEQKMEELRKRHGSPDYRNASGVMRSVLVRVLGETYIEETAQITAPLVLVWGANDTQVPVEVAQAAAKVAPHATVDVVDNAGHDIINSPLSPRLRTHLDALLRDQ